MERERDASKFNPKKICVNASQKKKFRTEGNPIVKLEPRDAFKPDVENASVSPGHIHNIYSSQEQLRNCGNILYMVFPL